MSFGVSDWNSVYRQYAQMSQVTQWQHRFQNNSEIRFESTNEVRTSAGLSGVVIDDMMDDPPKPLRAAREEPTLMEVWRD